MPWVKFEADFDHRIPGQTTAYKAGWTGLVTTACARAAEAAGRGKRVAKPRPQLQPQEEVKDGRA